MTQHNVPLARSARAHEKCAPRHECGSTHEQGVRKHVSWARTGIGDRRWVAQARVPGLLAVVIVVLAVSALLIGDYPLHMQDPMSWFFVWQLRAPRLLLALIIGVALGMSGEIFQTLSANPLGSPDITGFSTGAATGALVQILIYGASPTAIAIGALVGGVLTGTVVYLLSRGQAFSGITFVLIGIGVAAMLQAVNALLMVRASLTSAQTAAQWMAGSLNATTWPLTSVIGTCILILVPCVAALARDLRMLTCGDDLASALGVPVLRSKTLLIAVGIALVAFAVAGAGPIAFVALAAPQLARRVGAPGFVGAALMGACIVLGADIVAQRLFAPTQLPVGVVTGVGGGVYLMWLLARKKRQ